MSTISEIEAAIENLPTAAVDELAAWLSTHRAQRVAPAAESGRQGSDWWSYLQKARQEVETTGGPFRSQEDIEQDRADFRSAKEPSDVASYAMA